MDWKIEKATAVDAPQMQACVTAAYAPYIPRIGAKPAPMLDNYTAIITQHSAWVIRHNGRVIALLVLIDKPEMILLDNIAVHPDHQGKKIGKQLMAFAEEQARARGYQAIQLYTHELMHENQAIYRKIGYTEFARKQEKGLARIYMKKTLI